MNKEITYTTPEEQIERLKSKGLAFGSESFAFTCLKTYGYYNIINSYKEPYINSIDGKKRYNDGVTFEQIFSLFTLDRNLRGSVMTAMLDLEEHLRGAVAEILAKNFGISDKEYLRFDHYSDKRTTKHRFSLDGILESLRKTAQSDKDPIAYYRTQYGIVPPWILLKGVYLSTLVNFIRLFRRTQKMELIELLYGNKNGFAQSPGAIHILTDTLFICLNYRNLCAHGGRVYNYEPSSQFRINSDTWFSLSLILDLDDNSPIARLHGFSTLLNLLGLFQYNQPRKTLLHTFNFEINRHLSVYPQDSELIYYTTGVPVRPGFTADNAENTALFEAAITIL